MHDYDPSWDYPTVELDTITELTEAEKKGVLAIIAEANGKLCHALGFQNFEVFYVEPMGLSTQQSIGLAVYCSGTSSCPVIGLDVVLTKELCEEEGIGFLKQVEVSIAHELVHGYQDACGHADHDHGQLDEDAAETFGRKWADTRSLDITGLQPLSDMPIDEAAP